MTVQHDLAYDNGYCDGENKSARALAAKDAEIERLQDLIAKDMIYVASLAVSNAKFIRVIEALRGASQIGPEIRHALTALDKTPAPKGASE